ncbi:MAG: choice-of-anchor Q domain-containing protein [Elusimicrobiota bacterium]
MNRLSVAVSLFAALLAAQAIHAATYYVDRAIGSDSNTGLGQTAGAGGPLYSLKAALAKPLAPGDVVYLKNGTYTEYPLTMSKSGAIGNPITIRNFPGHTPIINTGPFVRATAAASDYNRRLYIYSGSLANPMHDVTIQGLEITNGHDGIKNESGDRLVFRNNYIHDTYGQGMLLNGCNDCVVDGNRFVRIGIHFLEQGCGGFNCNQVHGIYNVGQRWLIINNIFEETAAGWGLHAAGYNNTTDLNPGYPADHMGWTGRVANNTFTYSKHRGGMIVYRGLNIGSIIENNIFYENAQLESNNSCGGQAVSFLNAGGGHIIRNNLIYATAPGRTGAFGETSGSTCGINLGHYTESGNIINVSNPKFVNAPAAVPASPDYHLMSGSPAIDKGLPLSFVTTDIDGVLRPQGSGYDIGAFESPAASGANPPPAKPKGLRTP